MCWPRFTRFQQAVRSGGGQAGGLHLETTPHEVEECVFDAAAARQLGADYTSFCDPRLNRQQEVQVAAAWQPELRPVGDATGPGHRAGPGRRASVHLPAAIG